MFARTTCPNCHLTIRVPLNYAGRSVKCAQCQQRFTVGDTSSSAAQPASAAAVPSHPATLVRSAALPNFDAIVMEVLTSEDERGSE